MTDLEISKALALAIGWLEEDTRIFSYDRLAVRKASRKYLVPFRFFDYRDWAVIGPIAEQYDCFPQKCCGEWSSMIATNSLTWVEADTPQKAVALAVIGANK
jgi:hypothetical protein